MTEMKQIAVFLDRDGVINEEINYLYKPEDLRFIPSAIEAIKTLNTNNFLTVVVTNQAGVARGYFSEEDVRNLHRYMQDQLNLEDAHIDSFYYCPHHPSEGLGDYLLNCCCRKPKPGLLHQAETDFGLELKSSYLIGDKYSDVLAGQQVGCKVVLVKTGHGMNELKSPPQDIVLDYIATDILDAVLWIIEDVNIQNVNSANNLLT